jgi:hypothetical protein
MQTENGLCFGSMCVLSVYPFEFCTNTIERVDQDARRLMGL